MIEEHMPKLEMQYHELLDTLNTMLDFQWNIKQRMRIAKEIDLNMSIGVIELEVDNPMLLSMLNTRLNIKHNFRRFEVFRNVWYTSLDVSSYIRLVSWYSVKVRYY